MYILQNHLASVTCDTKDQYFFKMVNLYQSAMRGVAWKIAGPDLADDIVQDAWLSVVRNISRFEGRSSLKTWLLVITANTAKQTLRKSRRENSVRNHAVDMETLLKGDEAPRHYDSPEALLLMDEMCEHIKLSIDFLPKLHRSVLSLHEEESLSIEEISHRLKITPGNARVLLHRARGKVLNAIASRPDIKLETHEHYSPENAATQLFAI